MVSRHSSSSDGSGDSSANFTASSTAPSPPRRSRRAPPRSRPSASTQYSRSLGIGSFLPLLLHLCLGAVGGRRRPSSGRGSGRCSPRAAPGPCPARQYSAQSFTASYILSTSMPSTASPRMRVGGGALVDLRHGETRGDGGAHAVAVVLADVDDRQLPLRRHVERLVEGALVRRGVAEEAHRDAVFVAVLRRRRPCPAASGNLPADDAVAAVEVVLDVEDVHRAALALAVAAGRGRTAPPSPCPASAPRASGCRDRGRRPACSRRDGAPRWRRPPRPPARCRGGRSRDLPQAVRLPRALLEAPDEVHLPVHRQEQVLGVLRCHGGAVHIELRPDFPRDSGHCRGAATPSRRFRPRARARGSAPR